MIFGQLQGRSPQKSNRYICQQNNCLLSLTCHQLHQLKIIYDDIFFYNVKLTYITLVGQVIHIDKTISPKGHQVYILKINDQTGIYSIHIYSWVWNQIMIDENILLNKYIKIIGNIKLVGQFRPKIQINCCSLKVIIDFNQITIHKLEVIKSYINATQ